MKSEVGSFSLVWDKNKLLKQSLHIFTLRFDSYLLLRRTKYWPEYIVLECYFVIDSSYIQRSFYFVLIDVYTLCVYI